MRDLKRCDVITPERSATPLATWPSRLRRNGNGAEGGSGGLGHPAKCSPRRRARDSAAYVVGDRRIGSVDQIITRLLVTFCSRLCVFLPAKSEDLTLSCYVP